MTYLNNINIMTIILIIIIKITTIFVRKNKINRIHNIILFYYNNIIIITF